MSQQTSAISSQVRSNVPELELCKSAQKIWGDINPNGNVFDVWIGPTSTLFFLAEGTRRSTIALLNGDDLLDRFASILNAKEESMKCEGKRHEKMEKNMDKKTGKAYPAKTPVPTKKKGKK